MLRNYQYWTLSGLGVLCVGLALLDIALARGNQVRRAEVESRGQYIQQSIQLQGLYQDMVKALADLAVRNKDDQLRDLLSKEGIDVTVTPAAPPAAAPAPGKAAER